MFSNIRFNNKFFILSMASFMLGTFSVTSIADAYTAKCAVEIAYKQTPIIRGQKEKYHNTFVGLVSATSNKSKDHAFENLTDEINYCLLSIHQDLTAEILEANDEYPNTGGVGAINLESKINNDFTCSALKLMYRKNSHVNFDYLGNKVYTLSLKRDAVTRGDQKRCNMPFKYGRTIKDIYVPR